MLTGSCNANANILFAGFKKGSTAAEAAAFDLKKQGIAKMLDAHPGGTDAVYQSLCKTYISAK